jgi:hypothetical protein
MKIIIFFIVAYLFFACGNAKQVKNIESGQTENHSAKDTNCRFTISFISFGGGIDKNAKKEFEQFIIDFELKNNIKIAFERKYWGKEGEVDFCFMLNELKKEEQEYFILQSKNQLTSSSRVRFHENILKEPKQK